jgi:uncharacterized delta-60 repeat protein
LDRTFTAISNKSISHKQGENLIGPSSSSRIDARTSRIALVVTLLSLVAATPAAAKPRSVLVDRSFGVQGTISRAISRNPEGPLTAIEFAATPDGGVLIASGQTIVRYGKNGRLDRSFGNGGEVGIEGLPETQFKLAGVAVDSRGRVVVAGTATDLSHLSPGPQYGFRLPVESGEVLRYTPTGKPDLSFGERGVFSSTFGLQPPTVTIGSPPTPFRYESPAVTLVGLGIDPNNRPLLTGVGAKEMSGCRDSAYGGQRVNESFAARLTAGGQLDPSFGESGVRSVKAMREVRKPIFDPRGGGIVFTGGLADGCPAESAPAVVGHLSGRGGPDGAFGPEGWKGLESTEGGRDAFGGSAVAVDDHGRILLLRTDEDRLDAEVARLLPNGAFDRHFGRRGIARVPRVAVAHITTIAADSRGGVLLTGWHPREHCSRCAQGHGVRLRKMFVLLRLRPNGKIDSHFSGPRGVVTSFPGFGPKTEAVGRQILLDSSRHILVGGTIRSNRFSAGLGIGLIRYRAQR